MTKTTIFIGKLEMVHFEGINESGTLWGDHFEGLELECRKYNDDSIDVDVYLSNRKGFILALHGLKSITYGPMAADYADLKEVKFYGE